MVASLCLRIVLFANPRLRRERGVCRWPGQLLGARKLASATGLVRPSSELGNSFLLERHRLDSIRLRLRKLEGGRLLDVACAVVGSHAHRLQMRKAPTVSAYSFES